MRRWDGRALAPINSDILSSLIIPLEARGGVGWGGCVDPQVDDTDKSHLNVNLMSTTNGRGLPQYVA